MHIRRLVFLSILLDSFEGVGETRGEPSGEARVSSVPESGTWRRGQVVSRSTAEASETQHPGNCEHVIAMNFIELSFDRLVA